MKKYLLAIFWGGLLSGAQPVPRLKQPINSDQKFVLEGHKRSVLRIAKDLGEASPALVIPNLQLHFTMSAAQAADLANLLAQQRDRTSASYHQWLTPVEFAARFGVNEADLARLKQWLEQQGFENVHPAASGTFLRMTGSIAALNNAFGVAMHDYQLNGRTFYANTENPSLPRALQGLVSNLKGLTSYHARPFVVRRPNPQISVGINGNHFLGPADLATIYDLNTVYNQGTNGTGQTIAVVGESNIHLSDIEAFQTASGLPVNDPQIVPAGTNPGFNASEVEADLDLEWTGAVARGATILYVNSLDALESAQYAVENNLAPIISISYGLCEAEAATADLSTYNAAFQQANAQGITVIAASGDTGAAACDHDQDATGTPETAASFGLAVSFPASSPFVTAVGGTEFDESQGSFWDSGGHALSYIPEIAWNDTPTFKALAASGGGVSRQFTKPAWQAGTGVPADGQRDVPDIALSASPVHDPYLICSGGSCSNGFAPPLSQIYFVGGTSCAAPVFSGIVALLNQAYQGRQGNVNPALYALASLNSGVFHDVELGDNIVPCVNGTPNCVNNTMGFTTGPGYDQVTGLGSVDAAHLVNQWGADFLVAVNPSSISLGAGKAASTNVQVTRFASFNGSVSFSCVVSSGLTNTTCSVPGSVTGSGVATLTISNSSTAASLLWRERTPKSSAALFVIAAASLMLWGIRRRETGLAGLATICCLSLAGCGSGTSTTASIGSKSLTGNVTVTATSGILQHSVVVPVTIS